LRSAAQRVFPPEARLIALPGGDSFVLLASWPLGDKQRPSKRSKTVRLNLTAEAMEDYRRGTDGARDYADARLEAIVKKLLATFDPTHDTPLGTEPPIERWEVGTVELNG
jgi:hypothetical protein